MPTASEKIEAFGSMTLEELNSATNTVSEHEADPAQLRFLMRLETLDQPLHCSLVRYAGAEDPGSRHPGWESETHGF